MVSDTTSYKWGTSDNFAAATDMGTATTKTETGLAYGTANIHYTWAYNPCGNSTSTPLTQSAIVFECGTGTLVINHLTTGGVAPVNKSVMYGTVTNIPGETSKCWITRNLGDSQQATAVNDNTEASAGWYWQFNRKQGYKHDGSVVKPS